MILPVGDDNTDRTIRPFLNWSFIAANILVFLLFQQMGANPRFTYAFSVIPQEIVSGQDVVTEWGLQRTPIPVYLTLITSMFMHGGWAHLLGNMLFLLIFGDNLEDKMGRSRYLIFYAACGILAGLVHVFSTAVLNPESMLRPTLGASGAISGVLGGYLVLFPRRRVRVILLFPLRMLVRVPAMVAIGLWFAFQLINSMVSGPASGVAYGAHIGGFVAGVILVRMFTIGARPADL